MAAIFRIGLYTSRLWPSWGMWFLGFGIGFVAGGLWVSFVLGLGAGGVWLGRCDLFKVEEGCGFGSVVACLWSICTKLIRLFVLLYLFEGYLFCQIYSLAYRFPCQHSILQLYRDPAIGPPFCGLLFWGEHVSVENQVFYPVWALQQPFSFLLFSTKIITSKYALNLQIWCNYVDFTSNLNCHRQPDVFSLFSPHCFAYRHFVALPLENLWLPG